MKNLGHEKKSIDRRSLLENGQSLPFLGNLLTSPSPIINEMEFRPIQTIDEHKAASHLVYREYLKLQYLDANEAQFKFNIYQALPSSTTFVAIHRKTKVVGTLTTIQDSPLGLPIERHYKSEVEALRAKPGHHLFEASLFAFDNEYESEKGLRLSRGERLMLVMHLFKAGFDYLRSLTDANELVGHFLIKHELLYKFMQMQLLGEIKPNSSPASTPAVARHLYMPDAIKTADAYPALKFFFGNPPPPKESFTPKPRFAFRDLEALYVNSSRPVRDNPLLSLLQKSLRQRKE